MPPEIQPAIARNLADLVDYATDAIVSRSLGKAAGGNLSVFAFDAGQELSEHSTPMDAWLQVLDGAVDLTVGGSNLEAQAGDIVLLPGNVPHSVRARFRFKMLLTLVKTS